MQLQLLKKNKRKRNIEQEECENEKDGVGKRRGWSLGGWGLCTLGVFFKAVQT